MTETFSETKTRLRIVLVAPQIAANVGNVTRTALALGAELHLVGPFGFILDVKRLDRTSVGYWEQLKPEIYRDVADFWERFENLQSTSWFWSTKRSKILYTDCNFGPDVVLIFGNEEEGVSENFWNFKGLPQVTACRIPMYSIRCLNLATSVGILGYEVFRQWGKQGDFDPTDGVSDVGFGDGPTKSELK